MRNLTPKLFFSIVQFRFRRKLFCSSFNKAFLLYCWFVCSKTWIMENMLLLKTVQKSRDYPTILEQIQIAFMIFFSISVRYFVRQQIVYWIRKYKVANQCPILERVVITFQTTKRSLSRPTIPTNTEKSIQWSFDSLATYVIG